jgi:hypothetical protein
MDMLFEVLDRSDEEPKSFEEFVRPSIDLLIKKYRQARMKRGGVSPLSLRQGEGVLEMLEWWFRSFQPGERNPDIAILLCDLLSETSEGYRWGVAWLLGLSRDSLMDRSRHYLHAVELATNDGMPEFSAALLAFYVYSQSVVTEIRGADNESDLGLVAYWPDVAAAIQSRLDGPGSDLLRKSSRIAAARFERRGVILPALNLRALVGGGDADIRLLWSQPIVPRPLYRKDTRLRLESGIGQETLQRLPETAAEALIDAELAWNRTHDLLGNGLSNWSNLVVSFAKPFEIALVTKLESAYNSEEFRVYHQQRFPNHPMEKPMLGSMIHMLKHFSRLPSAVRGLIERSGVSVQTDRSVIEQLFKLQLVRNKAAHRDIVSDEEFVAFRKLLFDDGLLARFCALISRQ